MQHYKAIDGLICLTHVSLSGSVVDGTGTGGRRIISITGHRSRVVH
jgi:hypothetical protein